eukprot:TRINITY_DN22199_c0_g1_i1.p1 TRINITY_DN22199_c0_g1~~TRINITY_DN22199_c0_g1_i1.p1  ORF type:complete len:430 (+),score=63.70 TRINITY_DN22199_c0_g1_i1:28-1290(+)
MNRVLRRLPCARSMGKRWWSEEFREMMTYPELNCKLGNVPYYEGHPLVAVLFGWPGATEEGMRPYGEMYDRMGVPCVMVIPTWKEVTNNDQADLRVQRVYAELQVELCNLRTDLVLHFFSTSFLQFLPPMVYLARRVTKGIIFDSCPTQRGEDIYHSATRVSEAARLLRESGQIPGIGAARRAFATFRNLTHELVDGFVPKVREYTALEMMYAPQLYLRSEDDPLILKKDFSELLEYNRERKNMKVWEVTWPGNNHMNHLKDHAEEYEQVLRDFVGGIRTVPVEQLEVGRGAGAEWPPAVPTDEEMLHAYKWTRAYLSPYHEAEVQREEILKAKRETTETQRKAVPGTQYRYPDGSVRPERATLEETEKYIEENTPEFPPGVLDLRGRAHLQRTPSNVEHEPGKLLPPRFKAIYKDESVP